MNHADHNVQLLNVSGEVVGVKPRGEVDKMNDVLHTVDVVLVVKGPQALRPVGAQGDEGKQIILGKIPEGGDNWASGSWAPPVATLLRENELPEDAARRALKGEMGVDGKELHLLGTRFVEYANGVKRWRTSFWVGVEEIPQAHEHVAELKVFSKLELEADPSALGSIFVEFWERFGERFY